MRNAADRIATYEADLAEKYPKSCSNIYCGASNGPGWDPLIHEALRVIEEDGGRVAQIKEKFGSLCLYVDGGTELTRKAVGKAQLMSASVCEECGAPGKLGGKSWLRTRCPEHTKD